MRLSDPWNQYPSKARFSNAIHLNMGVPKTRGIFGGPHHKDFSILGTILGSPYFGRNCQIFLASVSGCLTLMALGGFRASGLGINV